MFKSVVTMMALTLAVSLPATFSAAQAAPIKIQVAFGEPADSPGCAPAIPWIKEFVEKKTNGKYEVDIYFNGSLGNYDTLYQGMQFGTVHIVEDSTSNFSIFAPELGVFDMPYLLPTSADVRKVIYSDLGTRIRQSLDRKGGVITFGYLNANYRYTIGNKPWKNLDDMKGAKIRSSASKTHIAALKAMGVNPVPMPGTEILTALQQGVVDGFDGNLIFEYTSGISGVSKYLLRTDHLPVLYLLCVSKVWWDTLPPEDQAIFAEAFENVVKEVDTNFEAAVPTTIQAMKTRDNVMYTEMSAEDTARAIQMTQSALEAFNPQQKALIKEIQDFIKK